MGQAHAWAARKFAAVFHQTGNRVLAAKEAGSKAKDLYKAGTVMLDRPRVIAELERLRSRTDDVVVHSAASVKEEVHTLIDEAIKISREGQPLVGKNGAAVQAKDGSIIRRPDVNGILKGAELKGKTVAMFTDRQKIDGELDGKSDTELGLMIEAALLASPTVLEQIAGIPAVRDKVYELEREAREHREGAEGDSAKEAESVSAPSEAAGTSEGRLH